jgi:hypothetical protein
MNTPHPVFVVLIVALLGTAGLEYGLGAVVSTPPEPRETATVPEADLADTPSPNVESAFSVPATTARPTPTADTDPAVRMRVGRVARCGTTCRDVTAHLHNRGTADLTNVEVYTTIYAGGEIVWVDAERVGTVAAGDTYTATKRVEVSPGEALQIHSNDGSVRVETVVEFDQGSTVVTEDVDVR